VFQYAISIVILTFKRASDIYFIRAGEETIGKSLPFTLISLVAGWWGIPWGPIFTVQSMVNNFRGGKNVTKEVVASFNKPAAAATPAARPLPVG